MGAPVGLARWSSSEVGEVSTVELARGDEGNQKVLSTAAALESEGDDSADAAIAMRARQTASVG